MDGGDGRELKAWFSLNNFDRFHEDLRKKSAKIGKYIDVLPKDRPLDFIVSVTWGLIYFLVRPHFSFDNQALKKNLLVFDPEQKNPSSESEQGFTPKDGKESPCNFDIFWLTTIRFIMSKFITTRTKSEEDKLINLDTSGLAKLEEEVKTEKGAENQQETSLDPEIFLHELVEAPV
ncbi:MAG: hypothetical protein MZV64_34710 [Ignavibacteriales bacterium]|nr:hypothetical protein [Ignavibacteriales bacterium]